MKTTKKKEKKTDEKQDKKPLTALERVSAYARAVLDGDIVAGPHVRNSCRRHFDDLENGHKRGLFFSEKSAAHIFRFFEKGLTLSDGQFEGIPFKLAPMQCFILGSIFGWKKVSPEDRELWNDKFDPSLLKNRPSRRFRRAFIEMGKGQGKLLALDTPIPTPYGWSTMGDIRPGDFVIGGDGKPVMVVDESDIISDGVSYDVVFDDGSIIKADAGHLWLTTKAKNNIGGGRSKKMRAKNGMKNSWKTAVRTTQEIRDTLRYSNGKYQSANHRIDVFPGMDLPEVELPINPYSLGVWLGDGCKNQGSITYHEKDKEVFDRFCNGYEAGIKGTKSGTKVNGRRALGFMSQLTSIGLKGDKHIPDIYLRSSKVQRMELLKGLMDTDGTISDDGQCELCLCRESLAKGALELILSLGFKASMHESDAKLYGRVTSTRYRIYFFPLDRHVFHLKRKAEKVYKRHERTPLSASRKIVDVVPIESVPMKCIRVANEDGLFLCGRSMIVTHNSPLAGGIGLFGMTADSEPAAQIYAAAAKKEQAQILYQDAVKAARRSSALEPKITFSGGIGKEFNMLHQESMSFFRPISKESGKSGSGPRPHMALCDEVHEHPDRSIMEMLERGFKFRENPLLLMITNSGHDLTSVCWEEHVHAVKVAAGDKDMQPQALAEGRYKGEPFDDTTFSYVCALDKGDDPLNDPSCWMKANPMLGIILKHDYLEGVVKQANDMPGKRNGILRLHFCVWTDSIDGWMAQEKVEATMHEFESEELHADKSIGVGIDLSGTRDLTAMAFGTETGEVEVERISPEGEIEVQVLPTYDVWVEAWTPGDNIQAREDEDKVPYSLWVADGHLHAVKGERIRYDHVASRLLRATNIFNVAGVAYDNYAYSKFREECDDMGIDVKHFAHPQGGKTRAKPTLEEEEEAKAKGEKPAPGLWMPGSIKLFEDAVLDGRIRIRLSPVVMAAMMGATMSPEDDMGNKWFVKRKSNARIDPAVAIAMCLGLLDKMRRAPKKKKMQIFFAGG